MTSDKQYIENELYITLVTIAGLYQVETVWLQRVYDRGMLGTGVRAGASVSIPAVRMDRVATIVRMHAVLGLDLESIELALTDR
ncbi:MAG: hypothetical protein ACI8QZ_001086 [Chlamydiales bacterium]|jgi:hypothetical protein